jgi:hypothetical protein
MPAMGGGGGGEDASCIHFDLGGTNSPRAHLNLFNSAASIVTVTVKSELLAISEVLTVLSCVYHRFQT